MEDPAQLHHDESKSSVLLALVTKRRDIGAVYENWLRQSLLSTTTTEEDDYQVLNIVNTQSNDCGSGGDFLNGLLVLAEHLSARANETAITLNKLIGKRIFMLMIPDEEVPSTLLLPRNITGGNDQERLNLYQFIRLVLKYPMKKQIAAAGVWVIRLSLSRFMLMKSVIPDLEQEEDTMLLKNQDEKLPTAVVFISSSSSGGSNKDDQQQQPYKEILNPNDMIVKRLVGDKQGQVYVETRETKVASHHDSLPHVVQDVIFFNDIASTFILEATLQSVLLSNTYFGGDVGARGFPFSIMEDLLPIFAHDTGYDAFVSSSSSSSSSTIPELKHHQSREILWKKLRGGGEDHKTISQLLVNRDFEFQLIRLESPRDFIAQVYFQKKHSVISLLQEEEKGAFSASQKNHHDNTDSFIKPESLHIASLSSSILSPVIFSHSLVQLKQEESGRFSKSCIVQDSVLNFSNKTTRNKTIVNSIVLNVVNEKIANECLCIPSNALVSQLTLLKPRQDSQVGGENSASPDVALVVLGMSDPLIVSEMKKSLATGVSSGYLGMTWSDLLSRGLFPREALWTDVHDLENCSLFNAKLFPVFHTSSNPDEDRDEVEEEEQLNKSTLGFLYLCHVAEKHVGYDSAADDNEYLMEANKKHKLNLTLPQAWLQCRRVSLSELLLVDHSTYESFANDEKNKANEYNKQMYEQVDYSIKEKIIEHALRFGGDLCLRPIYRKLALSSRPGSSSSWRILAKLDEIACSVSYDVCARVLAHIGDCLAQFAKQEHGGLRSGPGHHPDFLEAFQLLENGEIPKAIESMARVRSKWLQNQNKRIVTAEDIFRVARHYESAAAILIKRAVSSAKDFIQDEFALLETAGKRACLPIKVKGNNKLYDYGPWFNAKTGVRIDCAGGWSDAAPLTFELGGAVCNVALLLNKKKPIGARARRISVPELRFKVLGGIPNDQEEKEDDDEGWIICKEIRDLADYCNPAAPAALLKASILCTGRITMNNNEALEEQLMKRFGGGLEIHSWSDVPVGSGLGTSSILAGCVLAAVNSCVTSTYKDEESIKFDASSLVHGVLVVEQMLTTGGGWQDQVGGLYGGAKVATSRNKIPLHVEIKTVPLSKEFQTRLNSHLLLLYTGRSRLARNLLQDVIRRWYARVPEIVETCKGLVENCFACEIALKNEDIEGFGKCLSKYGEHKKKMAPGSEPEEITNVFRILDEAGLLFGRSLTGAGGGGFMILVTSKPNCQEEIRNILEMNLKKKDLYAFYEAEVDNDGLTVYQS